MIRTILALPLGDDSARIAAWRQLIDLVAQGANRVSASARADAHERIAALRHFVPDTERRRAAAGLADRTEQADIVAIFAGDTPAIAAPVVARARLADAKWLAILPTMPPTSRAILRNRRDLSGAVERALASYGPSDFVLTDASDRQADDDTGSQIRNLVARIEAFRSQLPPTGTPGSGPTPSPLIAEPATGFVFETDIEGVIDWVEGATREALIGLSIGEIALPRRPGVDGQAAGAHRRRAPFGNARLTVGGTDAAAGDWLISAAPVFNPRDGRFVGYHGSARRPRPEERAAPEGALVAGTSLPADSLRQLVHELRTPLNAIQGFAEMIDHQILGPAAIAYRDRAQNIIGESRRLLEVIDDLDTAARLESARFELEEGKAETAQLLAAIATDLVRPLAERGVALDIAAIAGPAVAMAGTTLDRVLRRLIHAATGLAADGEAITVTLANDAATATITIKRPAVLVGRDERTLLDPAYGPDGEWPAAPILGLGFTLRLIANLARQAKGALKITDDRFVLSLPLAETTAKRHAGRPHERGAGEQG